MVSAGASLRVTNVSGFRRNDENAESLSFYEVLCTCHYIWMSISPSTGEWSSLLTIRDGLCCSARITRGILSLYAADFLQLRSPRLSL